MGEEIKPMVKDRKFRAHMSFTNGGERLDAGTVVWPGNPIDGKELLRSVWTPKSKTGEWGKGEVLFYLAEEKAPEFPTIERFIDHYTVKGPEKTMGPPTPRVKIKPDAKKKNTGDKP